MKFFNNLNIIKNWGNRILTLNANLVFVIMLFKVSYDIRSAISVTHNYSAWVKYVTHISHKLNLPKHPNELCNELCGMLFISTAFYWC